MVYLPDWRETHDVDRRQRPVGVAFRTLVVGDDLVMLPAERDQVFQPVQVPAVPWRVSPVMNLKTIVVLIERAELALEIVQLQPSLSQVSPLRRYKVSPV
jgi:hypothetical protein